MKNETFTVRANLGRPDSGKLDYVRFTADCKNGRQYGVAD